MYVRREHEFDVHSFNLISVGIRCSYFFFIIRGFSVFFCRWWVEIELISRTLVIFRLYI